MLPQLKIPSIGNLHFPEASNIFSALLILLLTGILSRYFQWHWNRRNLYKMARQFNGPACLPFIGNAFFIPMFVKDCFRDTPGMFKKYGNPLRIWLGPKLFVVINDPVDAELLLNSSASTERSKEMLFAEILGNGLVTAPSTIWKTHRKLIQPTMTLQILDMFVATFAEQSKILGDTLMEDLDKDCNIFERVFKYTLDSICETSMGIETKNQLQENSYGKGLQRYLEIAFKRMYKVWQHPNFMFKLTSSHKVLQELEVELREFSEQIIKIKREDRRVRKLERTESEDALIMETGLRKKTFMELLLDITDNSRVFTDKYISDETATMIAAGSETTAISDCFILLCIALHPDVQENVYKEVIEQLGQDRPVEKRDLAKFHYLDRIIKEALRLFPVIPYIARECHNDVHLSNNKVIPAGSVAAITIHAIQNDERYWEEPTRFDPDRFLQENVVTRPNLSYMAFGGGPRNCIGKTYAMMSMKTTIATLVRKYKFETKYKSLDEVQLKIEGAVTKPRDGYKIRFKERVF